MDFEIAQESIFEQILTDSTFKNGFQASDLCEPLAVANRVLHKLERDEWLIMDEAEDTWRLNPENQLSPYKKTHERVTKDRMYYATPEGVVRSKELEEFRGQGNEGDAHLWTKFALKFSNPHFAYSIHEPYEEWRTPDYLFRYAGANKNLQGEAVLIFHTYSPSNSVIGQVLDYLRRGYGVRILIDENEESVQNAVRNALSEITDRELVYGSFNHTRGWLTLGELITLNKVEYEIRDVPEDESSPDELPVDFSEEMNPSNLEGNSWKLDWDFYGSGYGHVGTFCLPEVSGPCSQCNGDNADAHAYSYEIYTNKREDEYMLEEAQVPGPSVRVLSRARLKELVQRGGATRIGPATGEGLYH